MMNPALEIIVIIECNLCFDKNKTKQCIAAYCSALLIQNSLFSFMKIPHVL